MPAEVFTIGHSTLLYEQFLALLRHASVNAIADVRTTPYSRHFPQFNQKVLRDELRRAQISYVFLGDELGGRPKDSCFFHNGVADYEKMAETKDFARGLERVLEGAKKYRIAMMCSEQDPLDCHRCLLVGRALHDRGTTVRHILNNGNIVDQAAVECKLMEISGKSETDLFETPKMRLAAAYRDRAKKVAFAELESASAHKSQFESSSIGNY